MARENRISYAELLARDINAKPEERFKNVKPVTSADFDQNYEPINANYPVSASARYTVCSGDTLSSIAQAVWGDEAMWYLIAEANGLSANDKLVAGQVLVIPNKVTNIHNNANTFRPYNPGEAIGNVDPTLPDPPPPPRGDEGCGVVGQLIMVAVAVAVSMVLPPAGESILMAALNGAAASAASQVAGVAIGAVDHFDWSAVGQAALSAGVTQGVANGLDKLTSGEGLLSGTSAGNWYQNASRAGQALVNQGVSTAAQQVLKGHWNWQAIAASAVGAGAGAAAGEWMQATLASNGLQGLSKLGGQLSASAAGALVASQVMGDNWATTRGKMGSAFVSSLGNVVGNAIGESIASASQQNPAPTFAQDRAAREATADPYGLGDFATRTASNGVVSRTGYNPNASRSAGDIELDRLVLGDRLAALAAPQSAGSTIPDVYLAPDGSGHLTPQAAVVIEGRRNMTLPELDHSGYFAPGFVTSSYQQAVGMMSDRNAPWYERGLGLFAATAMAPTMLAEEAGRALLNVPYHARQMGQNAAQFNLARTTDERVVAGLKFVSNGSAAFVGTAPVIPSSVSLRPVMTAQEMAVAQFPGAEATAAARSTYRNLEAPSVADPVQIRMQELIAEGHGVQRHGAQVTGIQLEGRAVEGLDPMTGTRVDGVHGGIHQYAQHATKVASDEAYVFAEGFARNSQQFLDETLASTTGRAQVKIPLRDMFGDDFRDFVVGTTRYGPKASPTGFGDTIFSDTAYMVVRYKQNPNGVWKFNTMFPQPE